jgi:phosphoribosylamine--glycine ligase
MGAYSPAPIIDAAMEQRIMREIITPTVNAMREMGRPFTGVLFAGLMITKTGPRVIGFNARFGDPETQVILPRLKSDALALLYAAAKGMLDGVTVEWHDSAALCVVMAAEGYPGHYDRDRVINNLEEADRMTDVKVFHAGTAQRTDPVTGRDGRIVTDGGRVLNVTALGDTLADAQARAYQACRAIRFAGGWYRRDIAESALRSPRV